MKGVNTLLQHKYWWLFVIALFLAVGYFSSLFHYRIDLTEEKRFSLNASSKQLLQNIDSVIDIEVFLTGELSADYKKLSIATEDLLQEFKDISNNKVRFKFIKPGEELGDSSKLRLYDSLARLGVVFERSEEISSSKEKSTNQLIIPSALVYYKNQKPFAIDLRSSRKIFKNFNVINDIPQEDAEATKNAAEALLEYKFANAIEKLTRKYVPSIAYVVGNGQPIDFTINDLGESLRNDYRLAVFDLKQGYPKADQIDALLVVKPTQPFSEEDKLKLDQYVMQGGKIIWFVDKLYAELDSLMRSQADFIAFDRDLNLDDLLFKYGVRINNDLIQDLNCSKIPLVIGQNTDGSPRMQRIPWPYYPFLAAHHNNPISKNLDRVLPIFPSSLDTVKATGVKKTILLTTDTNSRMISSPALVSLNSVKSDEDFAAFNKSYLPVAVLLEGSFSSLFANRLSANLLDSVQKNIGKPFAATSVTQTKQIVVSDADIVTNAVSSSAGPMGMGMLPFENYRFANREFFLNCIDYLVSSSGIFEARNKEFTLRLLDKEKLASQKTFWQWVNIILPILVIIVFGLIFLLRRKQRYQA